MKSLLLVGICTVIGPLSYLLCGFICGWLAYDPEYILLGSFGGGFLALGLYLLRPAPLRPIPTSAVTRVTLGAFVFVSHYIVVFAVLPSPLHLWSYGFAHYLDHDVGLDNLHAWASDAIVRHERGELKLNGKCDFYAGYAPKIATSEFPKSFPKHLTESTLFGPDIGIHEANVWLNGPYVAITWYGGRQLVMGGQNLKLTGDPRTLVHHYWIQPGILLWFWDVR